MISRYYHLVKPGIIRANVMTAAAGFLFAVDGQVLWDILFATLLGVGLVIAGACVHNNLLDRSIDKKMDRTKKRGLVTGELTTRQALVYAALLLLLGFSLLELFVSTVVLVIGLFAYVSYVYLYGIVKRLSPLGTLVGTIPGGLSIVAGYVAGKGSIDATAGTLFLIMVCWQMAHFYAIAIYRMADYQAAGIPVLSVAKGIPMTKKSIVRYIILFFPAVLCLGLVTEVGWVYIIGMILVSMWWLQTALKGWSQSDDNKWARTVFGKSLVVLLVFCVLLAGNAWLP